MSLQTVPHSVRSPKNNLIKKHNRHFNSTWFQISWETFILVVCGMEANRRSLSMWVPLAHMPSRLYLPQLPGKVYLPKANVCQQTGTSYHGILMLQPLNLILFLGSQKKTSPYTQSCKLQRNHPQPASKWPRLATVRSYQTHSGPFQAHLYHSSGVSSKSANLSTLACFGVRS